MGKNSWVAATALGTDRVHPNAPAIMASEDFGILARHVPACLAFLGNGTEARIGGTPLHSPGYTLNDEILASGVSYYVQVVRDSLAAG